MTKSRYRRLLPLALLATLPLAAGARAQDPAAWLPPGAGGVVAAEDPAAFWDRLSATRLYAGFAAERGGEMSGAWVRLLGQRAAIGFYGESEDRPDVVLVADLSEPAAARLVLAAMEARLAEEKGARFSDDRLGATAIRVARDSTGKEVLAWAMVRNRLVAGTARPRLGAALDLARGGGPSMAGDMRWQEASGAVGPAAFVAWTDLSTVPGAEAERARSLARSLAVGVRWSDAGLVGDARLTFAPGAAPEALAAPSTPLRGPDVAPAGTLLLLSLPVFDADAAARSPALAAGFASFEAKTGIDVETEILPALGREIAVAVLGVDPGFPFPLPRVAVAVEARDEPALRAVMGKLESWSVTELRANQSLAIAWQEEPHGGAAIRYAPTPLGERLEPAYAVANGWLVAGSGRAAVRAVLDVRAGRSAALAADPPFAPIGAFLPAAAGGGVYADLAGIAAAARAMGAESFLGARGEDGSAGDLLAALENAPRLAIWWERDGDADALRLHGLLEVR